jgi:hypothetical protein
MTRNNLLDPPKVSVINSNNTHVASSSNEALDGGTTKRTGNVDTNRAVETYDLISGSPVVHKALGGKKLVNRQTKNESVRNNSIHW